MLLLSGTLALPTAFSVWDLKTGSCKAVLKGHEKLVNSVVVTPDGLTCVSGSDDKTLR